MGSDHAQGDAPKHMTEWGDGGASKHEDVVWPQSDRLLSVALCVTLIQQDDIELGRQRCPQTPQTMRIPLLLLICTEHVTRDSGTS